MVMFIQREVKMNGKCSPGVKKDGGKVTPAKAVKNKQEVRKEGGSSAYLEKQVSKIMINILAFFCLKRSKDE